MSRHRRSPSWTRALLLRTFAAVSLLAGAASNAHAGWTAGGLLVAEPPAHRRFPRVVADGAGGWYVAWSQPPSGPAGDTMFVQRLDANGDRVATWPASGVLAVIGAPSTETLDLALGSDGAVDVIQTWTDCGSSGCRSVSQHRWVLPGGGLDAATRRPGTPEGRFAARDGAGGHVVLESDRTFFETVLTAVHRDAADSVTWSRVVYEYVGFSNSIALGALADGQEGAYLLWYDGPANRLVMQRVTGSGDLAAGWPASGVPVADELPAEGPALVSCGTLGAMVVWRSSATYRSTVARVSQAGTREISPMDVTLTADPMSGWRAVSDGQGGALVVTTRATGFANCDIVLQTVDAQGVVTSGAVDGLFLVDAPYDQHVTDLQPDGAGGAYLLWSDERTGVSQNWVQRVDGTGSPVAGWPAGGRVVCATAAPQAPAFMSRDAGGLVVAWSDERDGGSARPDLYVARITTDGATPTLASCVQAEATLEHVRLRWYAADGLVTARVGRSRDGAAWADVGAAVAAGRDEWTFEDTDVTPGDRRAYRLQSATGEAMSEASWVAIPAADALAIVGLDAGPAGDAARVRLVLAGAAPARLEAYDVAGRRVASREWSGLSAGEHVVELGLPGGAALWFLRLVQGEARAGRCVVRLR